jgi:Tfp pilus assembly protein PilF
MSARAPLLALLVCAALASLAPAPSADELQGILLAREARRALDDGDSQLALDLLERARLEWPDADLVRHALADAYTAQGETDNALNEYRKAYGGDHAHRARFNSGALMSAQAEQELEAAGVPLDIAGLPEEVAEPQGLIAAIDAGLPQLERAREQFLESLAVASDADARESVAALTERMDELREMKEELERRQEEQEQDDEGEGEDENEDESEDENEQEQDEQDEGDQDQDQEGDQDQPPEDQEGEGQDEPPEGDEQPPVPQPVQPLTAAERAELLDKLEELEEQALAMERERRARERVAVEKDW